VIQTGLDEVQRRFAELLDLALPLPGHGRTRERWQALAAVAAEDLAVAKLYESHADALAILAELNGHDVPAAGSWAVWAAEPPAARLSVLGSGPALLLDGRKAWCSGAAVLQHALVTAWDSEGRQQLAAVELGQPGITVLDEDWQAVGMGRVQTPDLLFDRVPAVAVGKPGDYVDRPGFWHGGCGIAACWYGGASTLAQAVADKAAQSGDAFLRAHLGAIDVALRSLRALLIEAADWIDAQPRQPAKEHALRVRAAADQTARLVADHAGRALGAAPLCRNRTVAEHFADLAVFIRQTHAEHDLAELAASVLTGGAQWQL
jgi:hypothetical protein